MRVSGHGHLEARFAFHILAFPFYESEGMNNPREGEPLKHQRGQDDAERQKYDLAAAGIWSVERPGSLGNAKRGCERDNAAAFRSRK